MNFFKQTKTIQLFIYSFLLLSVILYILSLNELTFFSSYTYCEGESVPNSYSTSPISAQPSLLSEETAHSEIQDYPQ